MKNFKFLTLSVLFISLCAFQCEDDGCDTLDDLNGSFEMEFSSTAATYAVGDQLVITAAFPAVIESYSMIGNTINYDFELFEVQADNQPVTAVNNKIDISATSSTLSKETDEIYNVLRFECSENCLFEMTLDLKEPGYYGIAFKNGDFVSMDDCVVVKVEGEKSDIQNFEILSEIGTQVISYEATSNSPSPILIKPQNSLFFKVE